MQNNDTKGIVDGAVTIIDTWSSKDVEPCLGLDGDFEKRKKRSYYHNINCFIEAKNHYSETGKNTLLTNILKQLQRYDENSAKNINAFSIGIRGFEISFFMYIHDWHQKNGFFNKGCDWNGFLCLSVTDNGIEILEQNNTYVPQIITYNITDDRFNIHSIHTMLTWMSLLHGVPHSEKSIVLKNLWFTQNPHPHDNRIGY